MAKIIDWVLNGNLPAVGMDCKAADRAEEGYYDPYAVGLTKREMLSAMAMQGMLANGWQVDDLMIRESVSAADFLLRRLEKGDE